MKSKIIGIVLAALVLAATFAKGVSDYQNTTIDLQIDDDDNYTNNVMYYTDDTPSADPLMVGKWQNEKNEQWYKAYYDDYAGNGYFWGKEWDERDDVYEDDLTYHGNGWFRWKKEKGELVELAAMDMTDEVAIPKAYKIKHSKDKKQMTLTDTFYEDRSYTFRLLIAY